MSVLPFLLISFLQTLFPYHYTGALKSTFLNPLMYKGVTAIESFDEKKSALNRRPEEKDGILEKLVSDKAKTLKSTVKTLAEEIKVREKLNLYLLNNIDDGISLQNTAIMGIDNISSHYIFERFTEMENMKIHLKNNVLELEKEKRQEHLECWKDLMSLRKELMMALREYWDLVRRKDLLSM